MGIDMNDESLKMMAGMDRYMFVGEEEGIVILATDISEKELKTNCDRNLNVA